MVKSEVFGTRPSLLEPIFVDLPDITLFSDLWLITAIEKINPDPDSRYLLIKECLSREEFFQTDLNLLQPFLKKSVPHWLVHLEDDKVMLEWEETPYEEVSEDELVNRIIRETGCRLKPGKGKGSAQASPFSRFFRDKMGGGFSLTDIDYLAVGNDRLAIFEEKSFLSDNGGLVGFGQYLSFAEIHADVLRETESVMWWLVFASHDEFLIYDAGVKGFPERETVKHKRWGQMVEISSGELEKVSEREFKSRLRSFSNE
jgi:hypothetical protein